MAERKVEIIDADGRITISEEVVAEIARVAAMRVDGIARPKGGMPGGLKGFFGGEDISPDIKTELNEDGAHVELKIAVEYGFPVHEVAQGIQENVENDIKQMAGVEVTGVDIYVKKVVPSERRDEQEQS